MRIILLFVLVFCSLLVQAQTLSGVVSDSNGEALPGATILIIESGKGTAANLEGKFDLSLSNGKHRLKVSAIGYESQEIEVQVVNGKASSLVIRLEEGSTSLDEVTVLGKSEITTIKEQSFQVAAIDAEPLKVQNLDINQVLNTVSGVRIRESGGLGSSFSFSLNGFTGNQVKFFLDEIPMDYFGSSLSLNNIPINLISKIEVYKGVVPVHLGSDALGGAVNIVTNKEVEDYLNVSYSIGSFNTHRAALSARLTSIKDFYVNVNGFFNYSDNNYKIRAEVVNTETGKVTEDIVERFHDAYQSQTIQIEAGVANKPFADRMDIGVIVSGNYNEIQSGYNLTKVVGEAFMEETAVIPTFKYSKADLLVDDLDFRFNAIYKYGVNMSVDTSSRTYNWYGESKEKDLDVRSGEISWDKTQFRFYDNAILASANLNYRLGDFHTFTFNNNYSYYTRVGEDPISYTAVPFSEPNTLKKNIAGLSYGLELFDSKLKASAFVKSFHMDATTKEESDLEDEELTTIHKNEINYGFGFAATYFLLEGVQIKASYENTYRLPEVFEMFGNGLQILPSPTLTAEKSQNYNLGFLGNRNFGDHQIMLELGYLFRLPKNLIRNAALGNTSTYENLPAARINVYEGGLKYQYDRLLTVQLNAAYQDIVNDQKYDPQSGGVNYLYEVRLPNTPYLFGNALLGLTFHDVGIQKSKLTFSWSAMFVEEFYLKWPIYGDKDTKADIPRQFSNNVSLSYSLDEGKYNVSIGCTNVFDEELYDNFMLQKPGRAFNLKLSYFLK